MSIGPNRSDVRELLDPAAVRTERGKRRDDRVGRRVGRRVGEPDARHLALPEVVVGDVKPLRQAVDRDQLDLVTLLHRAQRMGRVQQLAHVDGPSSAGVISRTLTWGEIRIVREGIAASSCWLARPPFAEDQRAHRDSRTRSPARREVDRSSPSYRTDNSRAKRDRIGPCRRTRARRTW